VLSSIAERCNRLTAGRGGRDASCCGLDVDDGQFNAWRSREERVGNGRQAADDRTLFDVVPTRSDAEPTYNNNNNRDGLLALQISPG